MRLLLTETTWAAMRLSHDLSRAGFRISAADSADAFAAHLRDGAPDAVVVAGDFVEVSTRAAVRLARDLAPKCPVVVLDGAGSRMTLYAAGADAVLPMSVGIAELAARLRAMVLRVAGFDRPTLAFGDVTLDTATQALRVAERPVSLAPLEYALLEALVLARGSVLSRDALMTRLYGLDDAPADHVLPVYVSHLRQKLAAAGAEARCLVTLSGRGYAFDAQVARAPVVGPAARAAA